MSLLRYESQVREPLVTGAKTYHQITEDIVRPIEMKPTRLWYIGFIISVALLCFGIFSVTMEVTYGVGQWNLNKTIGWGWDATNFVWWEDILKKFILVLLCMIFARSAAMAFNRYLDRKWDAMNPRTAIREIPKGIITPKNALTFTLINCLLFIACCFFINLLCFALAPVALAVVLGYSYTKRFTPLCHLVLGLGLSLASNFIFFYCFVLGQRI